MLGRFVRFAPDGTITELMGFLDFCAQGTSTPEILMLAREGVIAQRSIELDADADGIDLKAELGLASEGYLGSQARQTLKLAAGLTTCWPRWSERPCFPRNCN